MHYIHQYASPLGNITMASNGESLTGLWFNGQKYFADTLPAENREKELPIFEQTASWLDAYFRGDIPDFTLPCIWTVPRSVRWYGKSCYRFHTAKSSLTVTLPG